MKTKNGFVLKIILASFKYAFILAIITTTIFGIIQIPTSFAAIEKVSAETARKAIQETAMAYYRRGTSIQYDSLRRNDRISPEQINDDNVSYTVCSGFIEMVYYEALGVTVPDTTVQTTNYAQEHTINHSLDTDDYNSANRGEFSGASGYEEIIYFTNDFNYYRYHNNNNVAYRRKILDLLEPGDILTTYGSSNDTSSTPANSRNHGGHTMLVYKIIEQNGERVNAILLNSNGSTVINNNNLVSGITFSDHVPAIDADAEFSSSFHEGSINAHYLFDNRDGTHSISNDKYTNADFNTGIIKGSKRFFSILRPTYYLSNPSYPNHDIHDIGCHSKINNSYCDALNSRVLTLPASSNSRVAYSGIEINKTVSIHNGSNIAPGESMTYTISVKNNSSENYNNISIVENYDNDLVEIVSATSGSIGNNTITWNKNINAGNTEIISYTVKVKPAANYGETIISTGTVANIQSTTISNKVYQSLSSTDKTTIKNNYENNKNNYGISLIKKVYANVDPSFVSMLTSYDMEELLGYQFDQKSGVDCIVTDSNSNKIDNDNNYLIIPNLNAHESHFRNKPKISNNNPFAKKVFNNYYSMLIDTYTKSGDNCLSNAMQNSWQYSYTTEKNSETGEYQLIDFNTSYIRSPRQVRVYPDTLKTGDILLYRNNNDTRKGYDAPNPSTSGEGEDGIEPEYSSEYWLARGLENGFYAYVYLEDGSRGAGFYGGTYEMSGYQYLDNNVVYGNNGGGLKERFIKADNTKNSDTLASLFSKDYYVILRPSIKEAKNLIFAESSINKTIDDSDFSNPLSIVDKNNNTITNTEISYTSSDSSVAEVDANGLVTIKSAGRTTIKVSSPADFNYYEANASYVLTISKIDSSTPSEINNPNEDEEKDEEKVDIIVPDTGTSTNDNGGTTSFYLTTIPIIILSLSAAKTIKRFLNRLKF